VIFFLVNGESGDTVNNEKLNSKNLYTLPGSTFDISMYNKKQLIRYEEELFYFLKNQNPKEDIYFPWTIKVDENTDYVCYIPKTKEPIGEISEEKIKESDINKPIDSFLEPLGKSSCFYKFDSWWSYEFCYHKHVRQYHVGNDQKIETSYYIGLYKDGESKFNSQNEYVSEVYGSGNKCDETGKSRQVEIRYRCAKDGNFISLWKEPSLCNYVLYFDTHHLCKHPKYKPEVEQLDHIICFEGPLYTFEEVSDKIEKRKLSNQKPKPKSEPIQATPPTIEVTPMADSSVPESKSPQTNDKPSFSSIENEIIKLAMKQKNEDSDTILFKEDEENNPQFIMESDLDNELGEIFRNQIRDLKSTLLKMKKDKKEPTDEKEKDENIEKK